MNVRTDKNHFKIIINALIIFYILVIMSFALVGGIPEYLSAIDGDDIKNVCDVLRNFVADDIRGPVAIAALIAIFPVIIYCVKIKFRIKSINLTLMLFSGVWVWNFIIQYRNCLGFYIYTTGS
ncbi:DUF2645 family protein [Rahnella selenatireducens]|uniref:DUF2645 family protein n=1 Tax=Rahnella selenatireducens TaxID=3389797 RepID=UPI003967F126